MTIDAEDKENLAREAFNSLSKVPESVDLRTVCKRFEDLRYTFFSFVALLHFHDEHHLFSWPMILSLQSESQKLFPTADFMKLLCAYHYKRHRLLTLQAMLIMMILMQLSESKHLLSGSCVMK